MPSWMRVTRPRSANLGPRMALAWRSILSARHTGFGRIGVGAPNDGRGPGAGAGRSRDGSERAARELGMLSFSPRGLIWPLRGKFSVTVGLGLRQWNAEGCWHGAQGIKTFKQRGVFRVKESSEPLRSVHHLAILAQQRGICLADLEFAHPLRLLRVGSHAAGITPAPVRAAGHVALRAKVAAETHAAARARSQIA